MSVKEMIDDMQFSLLTSELTSSSGSVAVNPKLSSTLLWGMTLTTPRLLSPVLSRTFSPPKRLFSLRRPFSVNIRPYLTTSMSTQTIEHVVLFKVKDGVEPYKIDSMMGGLNGLVSLEGVLHLAAAPIVRNRSSSYSFTHILHSRYPSKEALRSYAAHPSHVGVVSESVLPICEDIMAIDWVADDLRGPVAPPPGSAVRASFMKLKEGAGNEAKEEIWASIGRIRDYFEGEIDQMSWGENFSPGRAKGFSIASIAVYPELSGMQAVDSNTEFVASEKQKVRDHLEGVIVVDFVVPSPKSANL